ncbi:MAG: 16S rRNA (guanine(966)-N(2))-methyltransferase RsmD [Pseudomonadota bacterium]
MKLIAGRWGGRKIRFPDGEGLRPTPARLRETLFNWLMHEMNGVRVLDLFAGSGALAFESLSRGAREAVLVDSSAIVCTQLKKELAQLNGATGEIVRSDAQSFLAGAARRGSAPFDVVFLDPPYHRGLLLPAMQALEQYGLLTERAWIYAESETAPDNTAVPNTWHLHRRQEAGQVCCSLYRRVPA